ncbi:MAG: sensor histidine kinase [Desulfovibrio sp.]|uniref:sensor histidine kinase n=1 Tax=Desulfovibrio sp. 7SRBS1 TaxID=3378064 RepID=UPI003B3CAA63
MAKYAFPFRWFIILLTTLITLITLAVSGTAIFRFQARAINNKAAREVPKTVQNLALRTEAMLQSVEQSLITLTHACGVMDKDRFAHLLVATMRTQPYIRSMYFLDKAGKTVAVWKPGGVDPQHPDYIGIDFSYTPLFHNLGTTSEPVWSDKFVSALAGDTSIGVGVRIGEYTAIAELELYALLQTVKTASDPNLRLWVIDRLGEVLVDTEQQHSAEVLNFRNEPVVELALSGKKLPDTVKLAGNFYHPGASRSEKLGWLFLAGVPVGLDNPLIRATLADILMFSGSFLVIALLLSPFWSNIIASQLYSLRQLADRIADGNPPAGYPKGRIKEFNELSGYLQVMSDRILKREDALRELNQELEQRVLARTKELETTNNELMESIEHNMKMQDLLVQTEKAAALGRLVAGVAHELNTPIGNTVMVVSTFGEDLKGIEEELQKGLRKSSLEQFITKSRQGVEIAERNIERAAELISSFKHVASDQTSSVRRRFSLAGMIDDVLLTLHPMLKRSPHKVETHIEKDLNLDSYPGVIGQIITNLITNALTHGWDEGEQGTITINVRSAEKEGWVDISVADNGKGIPESMRDKIFDPFFTTRMGRGGTGLGLNIAYNGARNILGGDLRFESTQGKGTTFYLEFPSVAPVMETSRA